MGFAAFFHKVLEVIPEIRCMRFVNRLYYHGAKYFTARAGIRHVIVQVISSLLGEPAYLTGPARAGPLHVIRP